MFIYDLLRFIFYFQNEDVEKLFMKQKVKKSVEIPTIEETPLKNTYTFGHRTSIKINLSLYL